MTRTGPQGHGGGQKYSTLKVEAVYWCSVLLTSYQTTLCHKPEHFNNTVRQKICSHEYLTS